MTIELVPPDLDRLFSYVAALKAGWSPNTLRDVSNEELSRIAADPEAALRHIAREEGGMNRLPDGREIAWLPGCVFWIWDGAFCGAINLRHLPDTEDLPDHVSGHVGYSIVPWKQRRGIATRALALLLPIAHRRGLSRVMITCDADNEGSRRVIEANGGVFLDEEANPHRDDVPKRRYWVPTVTPSGRPDKNTASAPP